MRYFFDTEFIEDGTTIDLLSIGIVAEDGRELYMENHEADFGQASFWVRENVFSNMLWTNQVQEDRGTIKDRISDFCSRDDYGKPEFWAYYADYDWVVFCQLFGRMIELPKGYPKYCRDFKQWLDEHGNPELDKTGLNHNALDDARWLKREYERLR